MEAPPVQYVKTSDGFNIAYCEAGAGRPLVVSNQAFGHVEYSWRFYASWYQGLADPFHLIRYDLRGHGLSDRGLPANFSYKDYEVDLEAVLNASNLDGVVLFGTGVHGHAMLRYAIKNPQRVKALVLITCCLDIRAFPLTFHQDLSRENWDFFLRGLVPLGRSVEAT